jgi:hypothetical protein
MAVTHGAWVGGKRRKGERWWRWPLASCKIVFKQKLVQTSNKKEETRPPRTGTPLKNHSSTLRAKTVNWLPLVNRESGNVARGTPTLLLN